MLRAAIVRTCPRCQKTSYITPYTDFKFKGLINVISKRMIFLPLRVFQSSWWI